MERPALSLLQPHLNEFEKAGGQRWDMLCLIAKGVKEYSETICNETTVREIVGRVSKDTSLDQLRPEARS